MIRAGGRSAGIIAAQNLTTSVNLPPRARFNTSVWGDAYWYQRATAGAAGELFVSSGRRVLIDTCVEVGVTQSESERRWTTAVLEALRARLEAAHVDVPDAATNGATLPLDWLRAAVWYTYGREAQPGPDSIQFSQELVVPSMNVVIAGDGSQVTRALNGFVPSAAPGNPFEVPAGSGGGSGGGSGTTTYQGPTFNVRAGSSSGGKLGISPLLVIVTALLIASVAGGDK